MCVTLKERELWLKITSPLRAACITSKNKPDNRHLRDFSIPLCSFHNVHPKAGRSKEREKNVILKKAFTYLAIYRRVCCGWWKIYEQMLFFHAWECSKKRGKIGGALIWIHRRFVLKPKWIDIKRGKKIEMRNIFLCLIKRFQAHPVNLQNDLNSMKEGKKLRRNTQKIKCEYIMQESDCSIIHQLHDIYVRFFFWTRRSLSHAKLLTFKTMFKSPHRSCTQNESFFIKNYSVFDNQFFTSGLIVFFLVYFLASLFQQKNLPEELHKKLFNRN